MNKRIDFSKLGGYPLAQEDLDWLQSSYQAAFAVMADLIGDKVIIKGMVEAGGSVTAGWISIGGELVPFEAGAIGTGEFIIDVLTQPLQFLNGDNNQVLITRVAKFSAGGPNQYSDLKRIETLKLGLVPKGAIMMWSGAIGSIPAGWALCDGVGGTPNLSGKFIVGYNAADPDYNAIGNAGGAKAVTLSTNEQGSFTVATKTDDLINAAGGGGVAHVRIRFNGNEPANGGANGSTFGANLTVTLSAATDAHENRPPYFTLAYIIKL